MADVVKRNLERVIGRSLISVEILAGEFRTRLINSALKNPDLTVVQTILDEFLPVKQQALIDTELASWVVGAETVAKRIPVAVSEAVSAAEGLASLVDPAAALASEQPVLTFQVAEEAAKSLLERDIVTRPMFDALEDRARSRAFTIAQEDRVDILGRIRDVLATDLQEGTGGLRSFKKRLLEESLEGSNIGPAHLENVYRTNAQAAFHRGHDRLASNPIVESVFPYQEYLAIRDSRAREEHLALDGPTETYGAALGLNGTAIYRRDDPFWNVFTPPWGFQCRCGVNLLTVEAAAKRGVREAQEWLRTGIPPANPEHRLAAIPFRPEDGFIGARAAV